MGAPTVYSWDDAGAPAYLGSGAASRCNHFLNILKACLVDGYGSKSGAGWSAIGHKVGNGSSQTAELALANSRLTGAVKFHQGKSNYRSLYAMTFDAMTDFDNGLAGFAGAAAVTDHAINSGTNYMWCPLFDGTNGWWHVVANEHAAILIQTWNSSSGAANKSCFTYFGEFLPYTDAMAPGDSGNFLFAMNAPGSETSPWPYPYSMKVTNSRFHNGAIKAPGDASKLWNIEVKGDFEYYGNLCHTVAAKPFYIHEDSTSPHVSNDELIGQLYGVSISVGRIDSGVITDNHTNNRSTGTVITQGGKSVMFINEYYPSFIDLSAEAWP